MERTPARLAHGRRWLVGGMLAALVLATGPAVRMALAQDDELEIGLGSLSEPGYVCYADWICVSGPVITWPDQNE
jgi:hypothetical protein